MPILPRDEVGCGIRIGSIEKVFRERRQYHVRFFQRAYVWNREDQWERVWTDICGKPDRRALPVTSRLTFLVLQYWSRKSEKGS